ncbi:MAG TPA: NAD-dependent epimerase/dehydratase family protein, partial [Rhodopila sp.]
AGLSDLADDDFSPTYLRNATAYGSSPRLRADIVVNNLTGTAFTQGAVRLQSDGSPWRPLVHVEDIARAFAAVLDAPRETVHDQAFNVGRDEDVVQIRTVAEQVSEVTGAPVTFAAGAGPDARNYQVDFTKIGRLLPAFRPQWTTRQGIEEIWADAQERGLSCALRRRRSPTRAPAMSSSAPCRAKCSAWSKPMAATTRPRRPTWPRA